ncbi:MAG: hypothetical protein A2W05_02850 [Candidatus Schekmanbacteria bacterium RBG_16_38_10]|uniref:Uncharacterized protein n=1 Tax=Candidatus Schekmanbacteria bacterium RBG_16_38_10 TaxID=1817879 RepID=A0A1F7S204_9BACT|nr:MAG: hypothetical protein A2W05_02850 [Candidatus Schekmanbacteria bacterium RBG_16_38_10]
MTKSKVQIRIVKIIALKIKTRHPAVMILARRTIYVSCLKLFSLNVFLILIKNFICDLKIKFFRFTISFG